MKVHLERARPAHVLTFATECEPAEHEAAQLLGHAGVIPMFENFLRGSVEAFAMVTEHGRVVAMCGLLPGAYLWLHMPPAFKSVGMRGLRIARQLIESMLERHGELRIDVEVTNAAVVRMADWLGFKTRGTVEKFGRSFHRAYLKRKAAA